MSTKLQFYSAFAERTARLYKYPYNEQLKLHQNRFCICKRSAAGATMC